MRTVESGVLHEDALLIVMARRSRVLITVDPLVNSEIYGNPIFVQ